MDPIANRDINMQYFYEVSWKGWTPVYNQKEGPICWAVVSTDCVAHLAVIEGLKLEDPEGAELPPLSTQELITWIPYKLDDYVNYQKHEKGYFGYINDGFQYISSYGVHTAAAYPASRNADVEMIHQSEEELYNSFNDMLLYGCNTTYTGRLWDRIYIKDYKTIDQDDYENLADYVGAIRKQLHIQPLAAGIIATEAFLKFDGKGIYDPEEGQNSPFVENHAVLITGIGIECGGKERIFIQVKSSYGPKWADDGYAKVAVNQIFAVSYPVNASLNRPIGMSE